MFNRANQVQAINVNEWVDKLLSANNDIRAVEKIRKRLDETNRDVIAARAKELEKRERLYDWNYEGNMPVNDDFTRFIMEQIDYRMPDDLVQKWQDLIERYRQIKAEGSDKDA